MIELSRQKNVATIITFPMITVATGNPASGATSLDSEIDAWTDGAAPDGFTDCTNEATEIGSTGIYYLSLTQTEMNNDYIAIQVKTGSAGVSTQVILINTTPRPAKLGDVGHGGSAATLSLKSVTVNNSAGYGMDISGSDGGAVIGSSGAGRPGLEVYSDTGHGITVTCGSDDIALQLAGGSAGLEISAGGAAAPAVSIITASGDGISIAPTAGHGINIAANGTSKHGITITGGTAGTSDALKLTAGSGGVGFRQDIFTQAMTESYGADGACADAGPGPLPHHAGADRVFAFWYDHHGQEAGRLDDRPHPDDQQRHGAYQRYEGFMNPLVFHGYGPGANPAFVVTRGYGPFAVEEWLPSRRRPDLELQALWPAGLPERRLSPAALCLQSARATGGHPLG